MAVLRAIAVIALLWGPVPGVARGAPWRWPARGEVVADFDYDRAAPFRAGQRRGLSLAVRPGTPVRAACAGDVAFAGVVAGEPTVSVRCGALRATYQGIRAVGVEEGQAVATGEPIARAGPEGVIRLGAHRGPAGYVDPATLLAGDAPPLGPAPTAGDRRRRPPSPPLARPVLPRAAGDSVPPAAPPALAWLGLALVALALPVGAGRMRGRRRARRHGRVAAAQDLVPAGRP